MKREWGGGSGRERRWEEDEEGRIEGGNGMERRGE